MKFTDAQLESTMTEIASRLAASLLVTRDPRVGQLGVSIFVQ